MSSGVYGNFRADFIMKFAVPLPFPVFFNELPPEHSQAVKERISYYEKSVKRFLKNF